MTDEISQLRAEIADLKRHVLELKHLVARVNMAARPVIRPLISEFAELPRPDGVSCSESACDWLASLARRRSAEVDQQDAYTPALDAWKDPA